MRRGVLLALLGVIAVVSVVFLRTRGTPPTPTPPPATLAPPPASVPSPPSPLDDPRLKAQIQTVIQSMERSGHPPKGVAQGGRRGRARGAFLNSEGKLPAKPQGYYTETDVWPKGPNGRGPERLVFGKQGEVYLSPDHYQTFLRVK